MQMPLVLTNRRRRGGAAPPAFSPSSLYSTGSQGIWLDPSDLTTMFSDRAGTTPVTTPGTVVGLRLDKSKGLVLGAELVTNGDFAAGTTGWSSSTLTSTATVVSGEFIVSAAVANGRQVSAISCQIGKTYQITGSARVTSGTGTAVINVSDTTAATSERAFLATASSSPVALRAVFVATQTTHYVGAGNAGSGTGDKTFDNISVRELPGNHAVAPTDAARPIYGVEPKGGRRNLLTWSEDFGNAAWVYQFVTRNGTTTAPDGTSTAQLVTFNSQYGNIRQLPVALATGSATSGVWVKRISGNSQIQLRGDNSGGAQYTTNINITDSWAFYSASWSHDGTNILSGLMLQDRNASGQGQIAIWHPQFEASATATAYQRVTTAYDITESGVATCHYVQYDGSDDSMSTAAIDFTATDKMSVFAGVRKLSDAAIGIVAELSADWFMNNGSIALASPNTVAANFGWNSRGSLSVIGTTSNSFPAPTTQVLSGVSSISEDILRLRQNGVQTLNVTSDQGTGNYGNYPLFFGRRNNATLPFNGRDFGIIIVGKAASAGEITDTETWLAARTAQVTI